MRRAKKRKALEGQRVNRNRMENRRRKSLSLCGLLSEFQENGNSDYVLVSLVFKEMMLSINLLRKVHYREGCSSRTNIEIVMKVVEVIDICHSSYKDRIEGKEVKGKWVVCMNNGCKFRETVSRLCKRYT